MSSYRPGAMDNYGITTIFPLDPPWCSITAWWAWKKHPKELVQFLHKKNEKNVVSHSDLRSIFEAHNFLINNRIDTLILDALQKVLAHFDPLSIGALAKHHGGDNRFSRHDQSRIDLNRSAWAHNDNASVFTGHFQVDAQTRVGQHFQDHVKAFAIGRFLHMTKPTVNSQQKSKDTRTWTTMNSKNNLEKSNSEKGWKTNRDKIFRQNHRQKIYRNHQTTVH